MQRTVLIAGVIALACGFAFFTYAQGEKQKRETLEESLSNVSVAQQKTATELTKAQQALKTALADKNAALGDVTLTKQKQEEAIKKANALEASMSKTATDAATLAKAHEALKAEYASLSQEHKEAAERAEALKAKLEESVPDKAEVERLREDLRKAQETVAAQPATSKHAYVVVPDVMKPTDDFTGEESPCSVSDDLREALVRIRARIDKLASDKKVVLVTGGAGFIGSHTALKLNEDGDVAVAYDNFNAYYDVGLKQARAARLRAAGIEVITADVCDSAVLHCVLATIPFTHVLHLAAQAGVRYALKAPFEYVQANVMCFVNLLEAVKNVNVAKERDMAVVYASSSSVYGLQKKVPFAETDKLDEQASLYGATKKSNENIAHAYHNVYGLRVTGLRFFTVYGPWGRPDMAYFFFTQKMLAGDPLTVFRNDDGSEPSRDFTFVTDIVKGINAALNLAAPLEVFNLGNNSPEPVSVMIGALEKGLGITAVKTYAPVTGGDVPLTYADLTHSNKVLGYQPQVSLQDGLDVFLKWYREYYHVDGKAEGESSTESDEASEAESDAADESESSSDANESDDTHESADSDDSETETDSDAGDSETETDSDADNSETETESDAGDSETETDSDSDSDAEAAEDGTKTDEEN